MRLFNLIGGIIALLLIIQVWIYWAQQLPPSLTHTMWITAMALFFGAYQIGNFINKGR